MNFNHNGRNFRLSDIAKVTNSYADPPQPMFRFNGEPAIGLAISMVKNGDVLALGEHIEHRIEEITATCRSASTCTWSPTSPMSWKKRSANSPRACSRPLPSCSAVSFLALGWRPGIVVAIAIPLVLAITFVLMQFLGCRLAAHFAWRADHRTGPARR